jgi:formylglycine-generating enzyme required for sulfatase activity
VHIPETTTLKAIACKPFWTPSLVTTGVYTIIGPADGGIDSGMDSGMDSGVTDSGPDASADAGAPDAGIDAGSDAGGSLTWIQIPAGSYQMGCSPGDETCFSSVFPVHTVNVPAFEILEHEVTQGEYLAVMGDNPAYFQQCGLSCPVETVNWSQARAFCQTVEGRLPSESEWEYAARGGTTTRWYCGDDAACVADIAWHAANSGDTTHPVKTKTANNYGLYDMSGNVWELVEDDYHSNYSGAPDDGSAWIDKPDRGYDRVGRGGSWSEGAGSVGSSYRVAIEPVTAREGIGFRCSRGWDGGADAGVDGGEQDSGALPDAGVDAGGQDGGVFPDAGADAGYDAGTGDGGSLTWIQIPAGSYQMGCSPGDSTCVFDEKPTHMVNVPGFRILEHEVTQGEYLAVIGNNPSFKTECGLDCPVETVNWDQAKAFCAAAGGRLPSESEWEYAARGGTTTSWYCGSDQSCVANIAWYEANSGNTTHPVKAKTANDYGLYDMTGNVWEWVEDDYHTDYTGAPNDGSAWIDTPRGLYRRIRGGSWNEDSPSLIRSSSRSSSAPIVANMETGFRCAGD